MERKVQKRPLRSLDLADAISWDHCQMLRRLDGEAQSDASLIRPSTKSRSRVERKNPRRGPCF
jgi:hypothetical protein